MKTDRELLELAAKAVGYHLEFLCDMPHMIVEEWSGDPSQHPEQRAIEWSPLTDDGDALRLAHALGMQLNLDECNDMNDVRTDIVMAAAAIGESK